MKRILLLLVAALTVAVTQAQFITRATPARDSVVNGTTKYITFNSTPTKVVGFSLVGLKSTGTVSGYAVLQVRTDTVPNQATSAWEDYQYAGTGKRDTLFFTDVTAAQGHSFPVYQSFNGARFKVVTTGTQKLYLYGSYLKR